MKSDLDISSLMVDQCDRLFAKLVDAKLLNAVESGVHPAELARRTDELGLSLILVPEADGGAGLSWADVGGVFEILGYHAVPLLLGEEIIANWALSNAGMAIPNVRLGLSADILEFDASANTVSGVCILPWSEDVSAFVAIARSGPSFFLCLLDPRSGSGEFAIGVGRDPRKRIAFDGSKPLDFAQCDFGEAGLLPYAAILRAAQISGALAQMLSQSVEYGNTRVQFGRPIGKFQAIQHMIAELAAEAAATKAGVQLALRGVDSGRVMQSAAIAKIRASMAVGKGTAIAHEVHGAIGVTEEHVLHHYTRRAWQWRADAGDEHTWAELLGRSVLAQEPEQFWPSLVALFDRHGVGGEA
jgi:acyl-CoA dehydrogenase